MALTTPCVHETVLEYALDGVSGAIILESPVWWLWLRAERTRAFRFINADGTFTACREQKGGHQYWYAYRKVEGTLRKRYLGKPEQLTCARLATAARLLMKGISTVDEPGMSAIPAAPVEFLHASGMRETGEKLLPRSGSLSVQIASTGFLPAKITIPPLRSELVVRRRLYERLEEGLQCSLVVVSAPAGFGKSTLLASWSQRRPEPELPLAWVSLDEEDNDPVRFWVYVVSALQKIRPGWCDTILPLLQQPQQLPFQVWLVPLIQLFSQVEQDIVLVLDDFHVITTPLIHESLVFLLRSLPPRVHLVLLSRTEPPLSLARLRVQRQILELRAGDLRFTRTEITAFFQALSGLELSATDLSTLDAHTEGWAAGLQLVALALKGHADSTSFIAALARSQRYGLDYLVEEVLQQQSAEVRDFLFQTSLLERLQGSLCDAVTGRSDSAALLHRLERANMFLSALDEQQGWYRYHPLFRACLQKHLQLLPPASIQQLHILAASWYAQQGLVIEAIHHWLAINDFAHVASLIEPFGPDLIFSGEVMLLLRWLRQLPAQILANSPRLSLYYSACLVSLGQLEAAEASARNAEHGHMLLKEGKDTRSLQEIRCLEGALWANRTVLACFQGDIERTIELAYKALSYISEDHHNQIARGIVAISLGKVYGLRGDLSAAIQNFHIANNHCFSFTHTLLSLSGQASLLVSEGHLHAAYTFFLQIQAGEKDGLQPIFPQHSLYFLGLGELWYEWNDLSRASDYLRKSVNLGRHAGYSRIQMLAMLNLARVHISQHEPAHALELLQEVERLKDLKPALGSENWIAAYCVWLRLRLGMKEEVYHWAQRVSVFLDGPAGYWDECIAIVQTRVLLDQGCFAEALNVLERVLPEAISQGHLSNTAQLFVLQARIQAALGEQSAAMEALEQALIRARPEGFVRTFVDEGHAVETLLRQMLERGRDREYIEFLLAAFEASNETDRQPRLSGVAVTLSERELHILQQLARDKSHQQIAQELAVAPSTVRTHINNIYARLGVHSRTQALIRARDLLLLT